MWQLFYFQSGMTVSIWCWTGNSTTRERISERFLSMSTFGRCPRRGAWWSGPRVSLVQIILLSPVFEFETKMLDFKAASSQKFYRNRYNHQPTSNIIIIQSPISLILKWFSLMLRARAVHLYSPLMTHCSRSHTRKANTAIQFKDSPGARHVYKHQHKSYLLIRPH